MNISVDNLTSQQLAQIAAYAQQQQSATHDSYTDWDSKTKLPISKAAEVTDKVTENALNTIANSKVPGSGFLSYFLPTHDRNEGIGTLYHFSTKFFNGQEESSQRTLIELNATLNYLVSGNEKGFWKKITGFGYTKEKADTAVNKFISEYNIPEKLNKLAKEVSATNFAMGQTIHLNEHQHLDLLKGFKKEAELKGFDPNVAWAQYSKRNGTGTQPMSLLTFVGLPLLAQAIPTDSITDSLDEGNSKQAGLMLGASSLLQGAMSLEVGRNALQGFNVTQTPWGPFAKVATILSHFVQPLLGSAMLVYDPQANDMFAGTPYEKKSKDAISTIGNTISQGLQLLTPASLLLFGYPPFKEYQQNKKQLKELKAHGQKENVHQSYNRKFNRLMGPGQLLGAGVYFASLVVQKIAEHFKNDKLHELDAKYHINDTIRAFDQKKKAIIAELTQIAQQEIQKLHQQYPTLPQEKLIEKARENAMKVVKPKIEALQKEYEVVGKKIQVLQGSATESYDRFIWLANVAQKIAFLGIDVSMFFGHIADPMRGLIGLTKAKQVETGLKFIPALKHTYKNDLTGMVKGLSVVQGVAAPLMGLSYLKLLTDDGSPLGIKPGEDAEKVSGFRGTLHGLTHNKIVEGYEQYGWLAGMGG